MQKVTLREVVAALETRLEAKPLKHYWREKKNDITGLVDCLGVEIVFQDLTPAQVKRAMQGLELVYKEKFSDRTYSHILRWEHRSSVCMFRCTLYVFKDGTRRFVFTTDW